MKYSKFTKEELISKILRLKKQALVNENVSEKKKAVDDFLNEKKFTDKLIDSLPGIFYLYAIEGNDLILKKWNKNYETLTGYSAKELKNKSALDFFDKKDQPSVANAINNLFVGGSNIIETNLKIKNGNLIPYHLEVYSFNDSENNYFLGVGIDISNRVMAQKILRKSEEKYATVVENSNDGIVIFNKAGKIIFVNQVVEKKLGYKFDEVVGRNMADFIAPDFRESTIHRNVNRLAGRKVPAINEIELIRENGSCFPVETNTTKFIYEGENTLLVFIRDISKRKEIEAELLQSEEKYRSLIENLPVVSWTSSEKRETSFISSNIEKIYGFTPSEIYDAGSELWMDRIHPDDVEKATSGFSELINNGTVYEAEYRIKRKDGKWIWLQDKSTTVKTINGKQYAIGSFFEITEQKQAAKMLKQSEQRFRQLSNLTFEGIVIHKNGKPIDMNKSFATMTGYTFEELMNKNLIYFLASEKAKLKIHEQIINKQTDPYESEFIHKNGDIIPIELKATNSTYKDDEVRVVSVRNISERKKYQENLRKLNNELVNTEEKEKRRIAVNLHDHISQSLAMAMIKTDEVNMAKTQNEQKLLLKEVRQFLSEAIDNTRLITYDLSPPILYELGLKEAIEWKLDNASKKYGFSQTFKNQLGRSIDNEFAVIAYRAFNEMINNIIKHAKASQVNTIIYDQDNFLCLSVKDNGIGFDFETQRSKCIEKESFGLFSIQERLEYIGGEIKIESGINRGTEIIVKIPITNN